MTDTPLTEQPLPSQAVCYRHPDRPTALRCSSCGNYICGACSVQGTVGQFCPDCARQRGGQKVVSTRPGRATRLWRTAPVSFVIMAVTIGMYLIGRVRAGPGNDLVGLLVQFNFLVEAGEWYRIFTPVLLHASIAHILFNMYALFQLGPPLEYRFGHVSYLGLYLAAAGWGGAFAFRLGSPDDALVGASGAVFGLFGLWLHSAYRLRDTAMGRNLLTSLWTNLALNAALPFIIPGISWQGHLGGLICGVLVGEMWSRVKARQRPFVPLVAAVIAVAAVML